MAQEKDEFGNMKAVLFKCEYCGKQFSRIREYQIVNGYAIGKQKAWYLLACCPSCHSNVYKVIQLI